MSENSAIAWTYHTFNPCIVLLPTLAIGTVNLLVFG